MFRAVLREYQKIFLKGETMKEILKEYKEQIEAFNQLGRTIQADEIIIVDDFNMVRVQCKIEAKQDILINEGYEETETEDGKEPTLFFPNSTDERELHEGALHNSKAKLIRDNEVIAVLYIK